MEHVLMQDCGDGYRRANVGTFAVGNAIVAKTANYTITVAETGKTFSNKGAGGAVTFTLPAPKFGFYFRFLKAANQNVLLQMPAGVKINGGTAAKAYKNVASEADIANVTVASLDGTNYHIISVTGTWANDNA